MFHVRHSPNSHTCPIHTRYDQGNFSLVTRQYVQRRTYLYIFSECFSFIFFWCISDSITQYIPEVYRRCKIRPKVFGPFPSWADTSRPSPNCVGFYVSRINWRVLAMLKEREKTIRINSWWVSFYFYVANDARTHSSAILIASRMRKPIPSSRQFRVREFNYWHSFHFHFDWFGRPFLSAPNQMFPAIYHLQINCQCRRRIRWWSLPPNARS